MDDPFDADEEVNFIADDAADGGDEALPLGNPEPDVLPSDWPMMFDFVETYRAAPDEDITAIATQTSMLEDLLPPRRPGALGYFEHSRMMLEKDGNPVGRYPQWCAYLHRMSLAIQGIEERVGDFTVGQIQHMSKTLDHAYQTITSAHDMIVCNLRGQSFHDPMVKGSTVPLPISESLAIQVDENDKPSDMNRAVSYFLDMLYNLNYKRYQVKDGDDRVLGAMVCAPRMMKRGDQDIYTFYYEPVMDMENWMRRATANIRRNTQIYSLLTKGRCSYTTTALELSKTIDDRFPDCQREKNWFAFQDGIYVANQREFVPFDPDNEWGLPPAADVLDARYQAHVFHDVPFGYNAILTQRSHDPVTGEPLMDIDEKTGEQYPVHDDYLVQTPAWCKILEFQQFCERADITAAERDAENHRIIKILMILLGRTLFDIGEYDDWQVQIGLFGIGGSGKSCILKGQVALFDGDDVGTLSNQVRNNFPLIGESDCVAM